MATGIILAGAFPTPAPLSADQFTTLESILARVATRVRHYRPLILPFFQDFDRKHSNTVTIDQFFRVLTIVKTELTHSQLALLAHYYHAADASLVDYRKFLYDIEQNKEYQRQEEESKEQVETQSNIIFTPNQSLKKKVANKVAIPGSSSAAVDINTILHKIQTISTQQRKHVNDIFQDFDPLRKGAITDTQFIRCLTINGYHQHLSQEEIEAIVQEYTVESGRRCDGGIREVNYPDFVRAINSAFIPHEAELQPTSSPPAKFIPYNLYTHDKSTTLIPTAAVHATVTEDQLSSILDRMSYLSSTRRILLKPVFAAYDRGHDGCVTVAAFISVLSSAFNSLRLSSHEMNALCERYSRGSKGISYQQFCRELVERELEYEKRMAKELGDEQPDNQVIDASIPNSTQNQFMNPFLSSSLPQPHSSLEDLLASLRVTLKSHRLDLTNTFDDFDRLHVGAVTATIFYRSLSMAGLRLHENEIELLSEAYKCTDEAREGYVNYKLFLQDLSTVPRVV